MRRQLLVLGILAAGFLAVGLLSFALMERHWNHVARHLTEGMARDMAAIVDLYEASSSQEDIARLLAIGRERFNLSVAVLPAGPLPAPREKPFFDPLDRALSEELRASVARPFWVDTVGRGQNLEVRIKLDRANLHFSAPRRHAYASNSHIFLIWMLGASAIVLAAGFLLLRPVVHPA
jgi:two-component system osmolarity sensor histidine kinase EnvZ